MTRVAHSNRTATNPADHTPDNNAQPANFSDPTLTNDSPYQLFARGPRRIANSGALHVGQ
jgi:hypothetical protein